MPSTYSKRIWSDPARKVSVYVNVVDSTPRDWHIVHARTPVASFRSLDAARRYAESFDPGAMHTERDDDEHFLNLAGNLKQGLRCSEPTLAKRPTSS